MSKCKIISASKIEMLGGNLFFKKEPKFAVMRPGEMRTRQYTAEDAMRDREARARREAQPQIYKGGGPYHNNDSVRPFIGHQKFGFQTALNHSSPTPLPTAPPVVGGNVDWTKSKFSPASQYLHSVLSGGRPMNPPPALGSSLRLTEPTVHSIHTHY
jgi:hypothetical protein